MTYELRNTLGGKAVIVDGNKIGAVREKNGTFTATLTNKGHIHTAEADTFDAALAALLNLFETHKNDAPAPTRHRHFRSIGKYRKVK